MKPVSDFTFIDLFCGIGGFRLALEANGCRCVFSSDIDKHARSTYAANFGEKPSGDITKIGTEEIPDFDILCGGFPCQTFSIAGKKKGFEDDTRGKLFFEILRVLQAKRPRMFLLENVKNFVSYSAPAVQALEELGYQVHTAVLNSADFGLPQNRQRWYCAGFDKPVAFAFPKTGGGGGDRYCWIS